MIPTDFVARVKVTRAGGLSRSNYIRKEGHP